MIRPLSPRRVAGWTPVATLPASSPQRAVNINGRSRPYFGVHPRKVCIFQLARLSLGSAFSAESTPGQVVTGRPHQPAQGAILACHGGGCY